MKTLTLEIDGSIYNQDNGFLNLLPEKQCRIVGTAPTLSNNNQQLTVKPAFGLEKKPRHCHVGRTWARYYQVMMTNLNPTQKRIN